ncbi:hypothetical protein FAES_0362 [Fibrella aestuarina BUZ 2]|uniref:Uncharacterized protein n=1 Tax=Fibrella aestuarina BUZ 2 TaxID=1166018 RepID=I0K2M2_9BACT|nr:hypothetical protein [Fibrella aestuarina]CCG98375.1 hypothetical protein FAES_0362 [Fibrella aestuarina BUZ 2]
MTSYQVVRNTFFVNANPGLITYIRFGIAWNDLTTDQGLTLINQVKGSPLTLRIPVMTLALMLYQNQQPN